MGASSLPAAFAFLSDQTNPAADAALVEVLPTLNPFAQAAALDLLVKRGHASGLANVVGRFRDYGDSLQQLIVTGVNELSAGVRVALSASSFDFRAGAIELIVRGQAVRLAYLVADALRTPCPRTRELAAVALYRMTVELRKRIDHADSAEERIELDSQADALAEALGTGLRAWEVHSQPKVLEAVLWLGERTEPAIRAKLKERRTKIAGALGGLIAGTSDPKQAGCVVRALAIPELRNYAADAISRCKELAFMEAVVAESWLLGDAEIELGCRRIRELPFVVEILHSAAETDGAKIAAVVRLVAASSGSPAHKAERWRDLIGIGNDEVMQAVVWRLTCDKSESSGDLLAVVAARPGCSAAAMATRELRRRRGELTALPAAGTSDAVDAAGGNAAAVFESYWRRFDELDALDRGEMEAIIRCEVDELPSVVRHKLACLDGLDRARALRVVARLELAGEVAESIYRLVSDRDATVRSLAVTMLADLPGPTTARLLGIAVNDEDARVQANAVEALDRLNDPNRVRRTESKLESASGRVRANAIHLLLAAELRAAGEALLDMLEDNSPTHRLGALWVIEQLCLRSVLPRLVEMGQGDSDARVRERAKHVAATIRQGGTGAPVRVAERRRESEDRTNSIGPSS